MTNDNIEQATVEIYNFIDKLEAYQAAQTKLAAEYPEPPCWSVIPPKESGALRRASMDLTRALSKMRNG